MSRPLSNGVGIAFDPLAELADVQRRRMTHTRFWSRVDRTGEGCWMWQGHVSASGYGTVSWCGHDVMAHRLAFALSYEPIPAGMVVMHSCDVRACCRPEHLSLGTPDMNRRDMLAKGRGRYHDLSRIGETNVNAKLTEPLVRELRAAWRAGESVKSIAVRTGLSVGTVHPMLHGRTWRHVA